MLHYFLDQTARTLGVSIYEVKFLSLFPASYVFAQGLSYTKSSEQKNLASILLSLLYLIGLVGLWDGLQPLLISCVGAYTIAKYLSGPAMPWIGFIFLMGHLSFCNIFPASGVHGMSITGAQMVLVTKLTAFCWNVHDGRQPKNNLSQKQRDRTIETLPPILDYGGYVLFFPTLFLGPACDFAEYRDWLTRGHRLKSSGQGIHAAKRAACGFAWILAFYKISELYSPWILLSYEAMQRPLLQRIWHMYVLGLSMRMRYYGLWSFIEGACVLSGLGYNGEDMVTGHVKWDRMKNARPFELEFAQAADSYVQNWNVRTHTWLRDYVYLRCSGLGSGFLSRMISFIVSAMWHGFNPAHYLSFVAAAIIQTIAKGARRQIRPIFLDRQGGPARTKKYYDVLTWLLTQLTVAFIFVPFIFPDFGTSVVVWKRTMGIP